MKDADGATKTEAEFFELETLAAMEKLMKVQGLIKMTLVPGTDFSYTKKGFKWTLLRFDRERLEIQLKFENPSSISTDVIDTMKIYFELTDTFLSPE